MGRAFVASLGTVESVLGQERARQPGFTQSLALLHLLWTATEKEGRGPQPLKRKAVVKQCHLLPSCMLLIMLVGGDI